MAATFEGERIRRESFFCLKAPETRRRLVKFQPLLNKTNKSKLKEEPKNMNLFTDFAKYCPFSLQKSHSEGYEFLIGLFLCGKARAACIFILAPR